VDVIANGTSNQPKSQNQVPVLQANGYHLVANYQAALANPVFTQYMSGQHSGFTLQQMQNLKATFATLPAQDLAAVAGRPLQGAYMHLANARNLNVPLSAAANNLKLPTAQPLQWTGGSLLQRPASAVNGVGVNGINGLDSQNLTTSVSPTLPSLYILTWYTLYSHHTLVLMLHNIRCNTALLPNFSKLYPSSFRKAATYTLIRIHAAAHCLSSTLHCTRPCLLSH
jgi:hypothetical protein